VSPRRLSTEIAADLEAKAAKMRAEADRRLCVASDPFCELLYEAEKALRKAGAYGGPEAGEQLIKDADELALVREARWKALKGRMER